MNVKDYREIPYNFTSADDKLIIIDLANDYPKWIWHTDLTWKVHEGFYGKNWIYSYTPNFGGKTPLTGELEMYATYSAEALRSPYRDKLVGFGSAPEGIENNEVIYELIADMGWQENERSLEPAPKISLQFALFLYPFLMANGRSRSKEKKSYRHER